MDSIDAALRVAPPGAPLARLHVAFLARLRVAVLVVFLVTLASGCTSEPDGPRVAVHDVTYRELAGGARILTGRVENLSDRHIPVVQVQVSLFDERNFLTGQVGILVHDIPVDSSRAFREPIRHEADIRSARVRSVLVP